MTLTDCVPAVLRTLADSVALNVEAVDANADHSPQETQARHISPLTHRLLSAIVYRFLSSVDDAAYTALCKLRLYTRLQVDEDDLSWDPEEADSCDGAADLFALPVHDDAHHAADAGSPREPDRDPGASTVWDQVRSFHCDAGLRHSSS